jgi:modulator of FtsH protease
LDKTLDSQGSFEINGERAAFIQKVYGLLTLSLLSALVGGVTGAIFIGPVFAFSGPIQLFGLLTLIIAMVCRKVRGLNLALLFGFTFLNGLASGPILTALGAQGYGNVVIQAAGTTFGAFAALTAYVFWAKTDFSYLRGFVWGGLFALIITGLLGWFFPMGDMMNLVLCYVGVLVFIGFILYDTSNIIHHTATDEYVSATLDLYLDIINLFWYILRIFMSRSRD